MTTSNGFTLVELLIAISVISVGIAGAFIATQQSISVIDYANSRFTAALLAQEGVEIIKNIRDTNLLQHTQWDDGFSTDGDYEVKYTDTHSVTPSLANVFCSPNCFNDLAFLKKTDNGFYNYNALNPDTKFKRKINITTISPDKLELEITVYWRKRRGGYSELILKQHIYNWF